MPVVGITAGISSTVGLLMGAIAVAANVFSIHRFWSIDHPHKVPVSALNAIVIVLLAVLAVRDVGNL